MIPGSRRGWYTYVVLTPYLRIRKKLDAFVQLYDLTRT